MSFLTEKPICHGRVMTIISVVLGRIFHYVDEILPFRYCYETSFTFRIHRLMVNDGMDVLNISAIRCSKY